MFEATIIVKTNEKNAHAVDDAIKDITGVESVGIDDRDTPHVPSWDDIHDLLSDVGERLYQYENHRDLNCPLREMRDEIEKLLREDVTSVPKNPDDALVSSR